MKYWDFEKLLLYRRVSCPFSGRTQRTRPSADRPKNWSSDEWKIQPTRKFQKTRVPPVKKQYGVENSKSYRKRVFLTKKWRPFYAFCRLVCKKWHTYAWYLLVFAKQHNFTYWYRSRFSDIVPRYHYSCNIDIVQKNIEFYNHLKKF